MATAPEAESFERTDGTFNPVLVEISVETPDGGSKLLLVRLKDSVERVVDAFVRDAGLDNTARQPLLDAAHEHKSRKRAQLMQQMRASPSIGPAASGSQEPPHSESSSPAPRIVGGSKSSASDWPAMDDTDALLDSASAFGEDELEPTGQVSDQGEFIYQTGSDDGDGDDDDEEEHGDASRRLFEEAMERASVASSVHRRQYGRDARRPSAASRQGRRGSRTSQPAKPRSRAIPPTSSGVAPKPGTALDAVSGLASRRVTRQQAEETGNRLYQDALKRQHAQRERIKAADGSVDPVRTRGSGGTSSSSGNRAAATVTAKRRSSDEGKEQEEEEQEDSRSIKRDKSAAGAGDRQMIASATSMQHRPAGIASRPRQTTTTFKRFMRHVEHLHTDHKRVQDGLAKRAAEAARLAEEQDAAAMRAVPKLSRRSQAMIRAARERSEPLQSGKATFDREKEAARLAEEEMKDCTFRPAIGARSRKLAQKRVTGGDETTGQQTQPSQHDTAIKSSLMAAVTGADGELLPAPSPFRVQTKSSCGSQAAAPSSGLPPQKAVFDRLVTDTKARRAAVVERESALPSQCTFRPQLNPASKQILEQATGSIAEPAARDGKTQAAVVVDAAAQSDMSSIGVNVDQLPAAAPSVSGRLRAPVLPPQLPVHERLLLHGKHRAERRRALQQLDGRIDADGIPRFLPNPDRRPDLVAKPLLSHVEGVSVAGFVPSVAGDASGIARAAYSPATALAHGALRQSSGQFDGQASMLGVSGPIQGMPTYDAGFDTANGDDDSTPVAAAAAVAVAAAVRGGEGEGGGFGAIATPTETEIEATGVERPISSRSTQLTAAARAAERLMRDAEDRRTRLVERQVAAEQEAAKLRAMPRVGARSAALLRAARRKAIAPVFTLLKRSQTMSRAERERRLRVSGGEEADEAGLGGLPPRLLLGIHPSLPLPPLSDFVSRGGAPRDDWSALLRQSATASVPASALSPSRLDPAPPGTSGNGEGVDLAVVHAFLLREASAVSAGRASGCFYAGSVFTPALPPAVAAAAERAIQAVTTGQGNSVIQAADHKGGGACGHDRGVSFGLFCDAMAAELEHSSKPNEGGHGVWKYAGDRLAAREEQEAEAGADAESMAESEATHVPTIDPRSRKIAATVVTGAVGDRLYQQARERQMRQKEAEAAAHQGRVEAAEAEAAAVEAYQFTARPAPGASAWPTSMRSKRRSSSASRRHVASMSVAPTHDPSDEIGVTGASDATSAVLGLEDALREAQEQHKQVEFPAEALATAPLATAPLAADPLATAPLATAPLAADPLAADPLATDPLATAPLTTTPADAQPMAETAQAASTDTTEPAQTAQSPEPDLEEAPMHAISDARTTSGLADIMGRLAALKAARR